MSVLFLFAISEACVVLCRVPKMFPRTSSIVQIIFSFWSFEISGDIVNNLKITIGLDTFCNQRFIYLVQS